MKKIIILLFSFFMIVISSCKQKEIAAVDIETYTCSMDPQVVEHHPGKCPICQMELTKVRNIENAGDNTIRISDAQKELANIKTVFAEVQTISNEKTFPAVVSVNQNLNSTISAKISGRVEMLYYRSEGEKIEKGLPLYQIYSEELLATQKQYLVAINQLKDASASGINYQEFANAAKHKLELWGMNNEQLNELLRKGIPESRLTVYSDHKAIISQVLIAIGDYVEEGTPIYGLADLSSVWIEAQVYSSEAISIPENTGVQISFASFPEKTTTGKITFANPEIEENTKLLLLRVEIANNENSLVPGMEARITVHTKEKESLAVPTTSILMDSKGATVWIKKRPGVYEPRMVQIGLANNDYTEVLSGIDEGDAIVVSGAYLLQSEFIFRKGKYPMAGMKM